MKNIIITILFLFISSNLLSAAEDKSINYSNGDQYRGKVLNGKPNGKGTYTFKNGNTCAGTFKNGGFYECIYTGSNKQRMYRKYFEAGNLKYEMPNARKNVAKCKVNEKKKIMYIKYSSFDWERTVDQNIILFCLEYLEEKKKNIKIGLALLFFFILFLIYLVKLYLKNNKPRVKKIKKKSLETGINLENNLTDKITRLRSLYRNGALTRNEFEKAKNKLLK